MKSVTIECPNELYEQLVKLVEAHWFSSPQECVLESVRHYLSGHLAELQEKQISEDAEWGLHGHD